MTSLPPLPQVSLSPWIMEIHPISFFNLMSVYSATASTSAAVQLAV